MHKSGASALLALIMFVMVALALFAFGADSVKEARGMPIGGAEGVKYTGYLKDGLATGAGIMEFADGAVYYGAFSEGRFNGKGVYVAADGSTFEGAFEDGQFMEYEYE